MSPCHSGWFVPLLVCASLQAQTSTPKSEQQIPTFQSNVRAVVLDVVVSTPKGEPVPGLHNDDFQVAEDGKPQIVTSFEEHKGHELIPTKLPPMPQNIFTNFSTIGAPDSVNLLLLDWLNTQPQDQALVHAQTVQYLKRVPTGTRLAVFTLSTQLRMVHGFTTDLSELVSAFENSKAARTQVSPLLPTTEEKRAEQALIAVMEMNKSAPEAIEAVRQEMEVHSASNIGSRTRMTLEALRELARYLSPIPGRKNVIWIAGSFPASDIRQTADMLTQSRVAIYPLSAEGTRSDATYDAEYELTTPGETKDGQLQTAAEESERRAANQIAMEELAKGTGGRAFHDTNGLASAMDRIVNDGARYYTLTYTPSNKNMDGKYRIIHVNIHTGEYKLSYRPGYYAEDPQTQESVKGDRLLPLLRFGLPDFSQILYKVRVLALDREPAKAAPGDRSSTKSKPSVNRYGVDFAISPDDLMIDKTPDGMRHARLEVVLIAYDSAGRPLNLMTEKGDIQFTPKVYDDARRVGLQVHREIDVPPGASSLRTGVYDLNSGKAGTLGIPLSSVTSPALR